MNLLWAIILFFSKKSSIQNKYIRLIFIVSGDICFENPWSRFTKVNIKLKIFTQKSYSKDVLHAACLDSVKVSMKLKSIFHILTPYRIIWMFVKRCSADQMPMAKFLKICSAYILRGYHCRTISIGFFLWNCWTLSFSIFNTIHFYGQVSSQIKDCSWVIWQSQSNYYDISEDIIWTPQHNNDELTNYEYLTITFQSLRNILYV